MSLLIIIVNYRTAGLTIDCLRALHGEVGSVPGTRVVVVDNASGDGSAEALAAAVDDHGWGAWAEILPLKHNGGFAAGNNAAIRRALGSPGPPEFFLLLNSDTLVRPGALHSLLDAAARRPDAGLIGPRLEWPDGAPQISRFRFHSPASELIHAAATGPLTRLLRPFDVPLPVVDWPAEAAWTSFACVLIRRTTLERVGLLDEGYFMYFEDVDYCRRARQAGWSVLHWPGARVVHLRGGSSPVKSQAAARRRISAYYYRSRSRYYAKFYGPAGPLLANLAWSSGRLVSLLREVARNKRSHTAERQAIDIWIDWRSPLKRPTLTGGDTA